MREEREDDSDLSEESKKKDLAWLGATGGSEALKVGNAYGAEHDVQSGLEGNTYSGRKCVGDEARAEMRAGEGEGKGEGSRRSKKSRAG